MIQSSHRTPHIGPVRGVALLVVFALLHASPTLAQSPEESEPALPPYLSDRGTGIPTSLFGTYVREREWLIYPFYEFTKNGEEEYKPNELGFVGDEEFLGTLREHEVLLFIGYGFSDRIALELEGALYTGAELEKAPDDPSALPERLEESGLGDVEAQVRWRWSEEAARRPELFSFFEVGFPLQKDKVLIGVQDWEFALGFGAIKGFRWGTLTGRLSIAYEAEEGQFEVGEYAVEYLNRVSPRWRYVAALEGEEDEVELILEAQLHFNDHTFLKLNSGFGVTSKAPDVAPEVGIIFSF